MKERIFNEHIHKAIAELGFEEFTDIQNQCFPLILSGRDVVAQSSTGSGKTAAFGLPILNIMQANKKVQMLVLTPTRELTVQVHDALVSFAKYMKINLAVVYGGAGFEKQVHDMRVADIVVGTPGRILDHLQRGNVSFKDVKYLVLDEADKMFEMGFVEDVDRIISQVGKDRQTMLFSATIPPAIKQIIDKYLNNPEYVRSEIYVDKSLLHQRYYDMDYRMKFSLLVYLLKHETKGLALIFCGRRSEVDVITRNLKHNGVKAMAIHGGLTQNARLHALQALRDQDIQALVATDVAARGLDIKNVSHVFNYDVPQTPEEYVHRIGRTARAGEAGDAITLLSNRDWDNFNRILSDRSLDIKKMEVPDIPKIPFQSGRSDDDADHLPARGGPRRGGFGSGSRGPPRDGAGGARRGPPRDGSRGPPPRQGARGTGSGRPPRRDGTSGSRSGSGASYGRGSSYDNAGSSRSTNTSGSSRDPGRKRFAWED